MQQLVHLRARHNDKTLHSTSLGQAQGPYPAQVLPQAPMPVQSPAPANILQQLVGALQVLEAEGRRPDKKMNPPIFKVLPGKKPDPSLFKANDWLDNDRTSENEKSHDCRYTWHDVAQEGYDDIIMPAYWNTLQGLFHR